MKKALFLITLLICSNVFAQLGFYVDLSGVYTFSQSSEYTSQLNKNLTHYRDSYGYNPEPQENVYKLTEKYVYKPGFQLSAGLSKQLTKKIGLSLGVGFSYHKFNKEYYVDRNQYYSGVGKPLGWDGVSGSVYYDSFEDAVNSPEILYDETDPNRPGTYVYSPNKQAENQSLERAQILYLTIPISLQYSVLPDRLKINVGVLNYFLAYSEQDKHTNEILVTPRGTSSWSKSYIDKTGSGLNKYIINGSVSFDIRIWEQLWLNTGYIHSFLPIHHNGEVSTRKARYRNLKLGFKYNF